MKRGKARTKRQLKDEYAGNKFLENSAINQNDNDVSLGRGKEAHSSGFKASFNIHKSGEIQTRQYEKTHYDFKSATGIVEFDKLLSGGFPVGSVVLLSGSSGSGKTIFAFQWLFEGIKNNENGIYITLTEPLFRSINHLEKFSFYDRNAIEQEQLKILDLREINGKHGFDKNKIINFIEKQVMEVHAKRLCIDSVTAIAYNLRDQAEIRSFIFELGKVLSTLGCTTILTSEISGAGKFSVYNVEEFISDAIVKLDQVKIRGKYYRMLEIIKVRGIGYRSEENYFNITKQGIKAYPKLRVPMKYGSSSERLSTGNETLDKMLHGGIFRGSSTLIAGSSGTGKSSFALQFIKESLKSKDRCLYVGFEESRDQIVRNARVYGVDLGKYEKSGNIVFHCAYPYEKFIEEHLDDIKNLIERKKISMCVIDSLTAISNANIKDYFLSFYYRLSAFLKSKGVTSVSIVESGSFITSTLGNIQFSTMTDNIIMLRQVELQGTLSLVMNIVKMRGSNHDSDLREYKLTSKGIVIGHSLSGYEGVMSGSTRKVSSTVEERLESLFEKYIGPLAPTIFSELKEKGLTQKSIADYVEGLSKEGILKEADLKMFKRKLNLIMTGKESFGEIDDSNFGSSENKSKLGFIKSVIKK